MNSLIDFLLKARGLGVFSASVIKGFSLNPSLLILFFMIQHVQRACSLEFWLAKYPIKEAFLSGQYCACSLIKAGGKILTGVVCKMYDSMRL